MNNILNNCKIVNIVWIDRGIILSIIYFILKYYDELKDKIIIISEDMYRIYIKLLFPKLQFEDYKKHQSNNFYFNIRKIIKNQDIVIDFMKNYKYSIYTSKIYLVPWYNMYDPLIGFRIDNKKKIKIDKYQIFINNFSKCSRANYLNNIWDLIIENKIMKMYNKFNPSNTLINQINLFNHFILKNYQYLTYPSIQYPKIYYQKIFIPENNTYSHSNILSNSSLVPPITATPPVAATPPHIATPPVAATPPHIATPPVAASSHIISTPPVATDSSIKKKYEEQIKEIQLKSEEKINDLIKIFNSKIKLINNLL